MDSRRGASTVRGGEEESLSNDNRLLKNISGKLLSKRKIRNKNR